MGISTLIYPYMQICVYIHTEVQTYMHTYGLHPSIAGIPFDHLGARRAPQCDQEDAGNDVSSTGESGGDPPPQGRGSMGSPGVRARGWFLLAFVAFQMSHAACALYVICRMCLICVWVDAARCMCMVIGMEELMPHVIEGAWWAVCRVHPATVRGTVRSRTCACIINGLGDLCRCVRLSGRQVPSARQRTLLPFWTWMVPSEG